MQQLKQKGEFGLVGGRILDRYVAREYLVSYAIAIVVVLSLRLLLELFVEFDELVETRTDGIAPDMGEVLVNIFNYYGPKVFEYFRDFSGAIVLLAAAFSLARMTRNNELVAVLASGVSLKRIIAPIIVLGFILNMLMVVDQEIVLPKMADELARRPDEVTQLHTIQNMFLPDRDQALVRSREYDPGRKTMTDILVILREQGQLAGLISAQKGHWDGRAWILTDGKKWTVRHGDERSAPTTEYVQSVQRYKSDLTPEYIWLQRNSAFKGLLSSRELSELLQQSLRPTDRAEAISEKHFRITDPVINMVMLLLGLPMLVSREKRSTKTAIFFAFMGAGGCFVVTFVCKLLAGGGVYVGGDFKQLLLAWLPVIVFLPLSVLALEGIKT